jgi:hypothetical protein
MAGTHAAQGWFARGGSKDTRGSWSVPGLDDNPRAAILGPYSNKLHVRRSAFGLDDRKGDPDSLRGLPSPRGI